MNKYEPTSKLAEELLKSPRFDPISSAGTFLVAEVIVGDVAASADEIEEVLRRFESDGLVAGRLLDGIGGRAYAAQRRGWEAREAILRTQALRHPCLINQREHALTDLVLALVMSPHIWNARMTGAFLGADPKMTAGELEVYLCDYTPNDLREGCDSLVAHGLLSRTHKLRSTEDAFEATGRGRRDYQTAVAGRLRIPEGSSILDIQTRAFIEVFNAWQSEHKPSRNAISSALSDVVDSINTLEGLAFPLKIVQATEPGEGAIRIDVALQEKITKADLFVGDLTPVYAYGDRLRVNENVLVEVGFALASKQPNQIVLLAMKRSDVPGDATNAKPTFDISHVRRHEFQTKVGVRRWLKTELQTALRTRGWLRR